MGVLDFTTTKGKSKEEVRVPLPHLGDETLIDTHAHLDMLDDPEIALARAAVVGLSAVISVVNVLENPERNFNELRLWKSEAKACLKKNLGGCGGEREYCVCRESYEGYCECRRRELSSAAAAQATPLIPEVYFLVGTHPHDAARTDDAAIDAIRTFAADPRVVGLGELGLDYHYDHSPRDVQREVFARQLELAHELDLPVCIHLREAHEDGLRILSEGGVPARGAILHCFNLDYEVARPFVDLGCYVSFAGPVTFKKADEVRAAAAAVPADRLLVETDCPFMAPEPFRGHTNEPALTLFNAAVVAEARGVSLPVLARETTITARRLFRL
ncbi:MAG: TatD family hydrolase [Actinomycetes bacterium]|jgi:TatD DNase family protein|nr:TatD family hydrolase [Actinomycetes bacterium]